MANNQETQSSTVATVAIVLLVVLAGILIFYLIPRANLGTGGGTGNGGTDINVNLPSGNQGNSGNNQDAP